FCFDTIAGTKIVSGGRPMRSCLTALVLLEFLSPFARAAEATAGKPYEYEVLLKFGANRLLTPIFCRQLADELRDGLQSAFGPVGTISRKDDTKIWLQLQGGAIPSSDMARWVPPGSVFAIVEVRGDGASAQVVPATYLRTTNPPANGQVECEIFTRYENPLKF